MRELFLVVGMLLLLGACSAEFDLQSVNVTISNIQPDGSAQVAESVKLIVRGNLSEELYDSALESSSGLDSWSTLINLTDVREHVNPALVVISDFGLQPQPMTECNPFLDLCHGELRMVYTVTPVYNDSVPINGTGLFTMDNYKPRTTRYSLNPDALSFEPTAGGVTLLGPDVWLTLDLPQGSTIVEVNPSPTTDQSTANGDVYSWNDMVLARFSVVFDVEESIDQEVGDYFTNALQTLQNTVNSQHGMAFLAIIAILVGSYVYITIAKKKREE
jgi:hypothetical protein